MKKYTYFHVIIIHKGVEIGFTTTICPIGAKKWRDEYNETLKGKHIVLIPDNDNEGQEHMAQVYYKIGTLKAFSMTSPLTF